MLTSHMKVTRSVAALATAVAAAALFAASALAGPAFAPGGAEYRTPDDGITTHQSGGVTPTDLARAVPRDDIGTTLQQSGGVTPTDLARAVPRDDGIASPVSSSAETGSTATFAERELAVGFVVGLALATFLLLAVVMSRRRISIAHS